MFVNLHNQEGMDITYPGIPVTLKPALLYLGPVYPEAVAHVQVRPDQPVLLERERRLLTIQVPVKEPRSGVVNLPVLE